MSSDVKTAEETALATTAPTGQALAPASDSSRTLTDLTPVTREQFAAVLVPCLALVAATGMDDRARREWLHAAFAVLRHIPVDLLKRGAKAAMARVDHPSKIVAAIMGEVSADVEWRRNAVRGEALRASEDREKMARLTHQRWKPEPGETAAILAEHGLGSTARAPDAPRPMPMIEDYLEIGVPHAEAEKLVARQMAEATKGAIGGTDAVKTAA